MARNKYPEETERKILEVSRRLFQEKGYDHTTIQDIVHALGMSKGAIYHHFKSKEEIYDRICDLYYDKLDWFRDLKQLPGTTGLEKMRNLLSFLLTDPEKLQIDQVSAALMLNPKLVLLALRSTIRDAAPVVESLILAGNADGSMQVLHPKETAEAFMMLINMWVGVFSTTRDAFDRKLIFLQEFSERMGMPIIDATIFEVAHRYYDTVMAAMPDCGLEL